MDWGLVTNGGIAIVIAAGLGREVRAMRKAMEDGFASVSNRFDTLEGRVGTLEKPRPGPSVKGFASVMLVLTLLLTSCRVGGEVPKEPAQVHPRDATVFIHMTDGWQEGYATGWFIATDGEYSIVATAGHVCDPGLFYGISTDTVSLDKTGTETVALPIYDVDNAPTEDLCLLVTKLVAPAVLPVAEVSPGQDDAVHYTGYPSGTRGSYSGTVEDVDANGVILLNIPGYFGASGSAVLNDAGEVVGVLSMGDMRFTHHIWLSGTASLNRAKIAADDFLWSI